MTRPEPKSGNTGFFAGLSGRTGRPVRLKISAGFPDFPDFLVFFFRLNFSVLERSCQFLSHDNIMERFSVKERDPIGALMCHIGYIPPQTCHMPLIMSTHDTPYILLTDDPCIISEVIYTIKQAPA